MYLPFSTQEAISNMAHQTFDSSNVFSFETQAADYPMPTISWTTKNACHLTESYNFAANFEDFKRLHATPNKNPKITITGGVIVTLPVVDVPLRELWMENKSDRVVNVMLGKTSGTSVAWFLLKPNSMKIVSCGPSSRDFTPKF